MILGTTPGVEVGKQGGYYRVYSPTDPSQTADDMRRMLNDWCAKMDQLIQEFENEYEQSDTSAPAAELTLLVVLYQVSPASLVSWDTCSPEISTEPRADGAG